MRAWPDHTDQRSTNAATANVRVLRGRGSRTGYGQRAWLSWVCGCRCGAWKGMAGAWSGRGLGSRKRCGLECRSTVGLDTAEEAAAAAVSVRAWVHGRSWKQVWLGAGCCCGAGALALSRGKELAGWAECQRQVRYGDWLEASRVAYRLPVKPIISHGRDLPVKAVGI